MSCPDTDELVVNVAAVNFSGRFKGQEVKDLGHSFLNHVVAAKHVGLVLGQQVNFRMTSLPADMELIGGQRAFILYDRSLFESDDDLQYRRFLRDLEIKGRVAKYFLPESNYALCKLRSKSLPTVEMSVISWVTDETNDNLRSVNFLRKLLGYAANLCCVQLMPVLIAGSFRLSLDDVKQVVHNEFEGFCCYGYRTEKPRRAVRQCIVYISCRPLHLDDVTPFVCGKIKVPSDTRHLANSWRNPEDAFYWDPVFASVLRRSDASSVMSLLTSPRALTPSCGDAWRTDAETGHQVRDESTAEETLRRLLRESERIRELVSDAASRTRHRLLATSQADESALDQLSGVGMDDDGPAEAGNGRMKSLDNEDEETIRTTDELCEFHVEEDDGAKVADADDQCVATPCESSRKTGQVERGNSSSYVDVYDERLIATNMRCYIQ